MSYNVDWIAGHGYDSDPDGPTGEVFVPTPEAPVTQDPIPEGSFNQNALQAPARLPLRIASNF
jgi:hypothetical protein